MLQQDGRGASHDCHTAGDGHTPGADVTHTLTEGCQTFSFTPNQFGVAVLRKALNGHTKRWQVTGNFQMTKAEARDLWKFLIKDGATRA